MMALNADMRVLYVGHETHVLSAEDVADVRVCAIGLQHRYGVYAGTDGRVRQVMCWPGRRGFAQLPCSVRIASTVGSHKRKRGE